MIDGDTGVGVGVAGGVGVGVCVGDSVGEGVGEGVSVGEGDGVGVSVGLGTGLGVGAGAPNPAARKAIDWSLTNPIGKAMHATSCDEQLLIIGRPDRIELIDHQTGLRQRHRVVIRRYNE